VLGQQAGERVPYAQATREGLAVSAVRLLDSVPDWPAIRIDSARRAAELITDLLPPAPVVRTTTAGQARS
jgi:hypothetical protein